MGLEFRGKGREVNGILAALGGASGLRRWFFENQRCALEEAAKIFFARVPMLGISEFGVRCGLVTDFEAFQVDDANVFFAALPDLSLLQFHRGSLSLPGGNRGRDSVSDSYFFFLPAVFFLGAAFFALALAMAFYL